MLNNEAHHRLLVTSEFGILITSLLLCNHHNGNDNEAMQQCVRSVGKRLKSQQMRTMCKGLTSNGIDCFQWLELRIIEIEADSDIWVFLKWSRTGEAL